MSSVNSLINISAESLNQVVHGLGLIENKEHFSYQGKFINRVIFKLGDFTYLTYYLKDGEKPEWNDNGYNCRKVKVTRTYNVEYIDE